MKFNFSPKTKALKHQTEALEFMKGKKEIALFDEPGLGKSKIVIDVLCNDLKDKRIDSVLVVCKKTLLKNWEKEILSHSYLSSNIISGVKTKRGRSFMNFAHFHIINYDAFVQELEKIKSFIKLYKFAIVLDESQMIKNPFSKITKSILETSNLAFKKVIITGTPIANKPEDLWSQFYFLDNGKTLGNDFKSFKKKFNIKLKGEKSLKKYEGELMWLRSEINKVSLRRTKNVLELPEKLYTDINILISGRQKILYNEAKKALYSEVKKTDNQLVMEKIDNYLVKLLRLTQIASNPKLIDDNYKDVPAKFIKLDEILDEMLKEEKVILWTSFRKNIRMLKKDTNDTML